MEFSSSTNPITVSTKEFNAFHNIDRNLYKRLVVNLAIDPLKSMQMIGLWLYFERTGYETRLIFNLENVADDILSAFANEAVSILHCLEANKFSSPTETNSDLPLTTNFTRSIVSLRFFFDNRSSIRSKVERLVNEVCQKAFGDIYEEFVQKSVAKARGNDGIYNPMVSPMYQGIQTQQAQQYVPQAYGQFNRGDVGSLYTSHSTNNFGWNMNAVETDDAWSDTDLDDKTIFLTFSKGYPVSENEVRDFFTQRFRGCIAAIYMQEVTTHEQQPLYAKLIVCNPFQMEYVLGKKDKAKFTINGKHVWARKFVRKIGGAPLHFGQTYQQ